MPRAESREPGAGTSDDARERADVVVVGGGPAGAATATFLAREGLDVVLLDRARFPRAKACAECLSPEASRLLHELDVLDAVERAPGARLRGMVVRAPAGALVHGEYEAAHGWRGFRDRGLTVQRTVLDPILLDRARAAGARVREGAKVSDVVRDAGGRATGVRIAEGGEARVVEARLVVGADGLRSIVARRLGLARTSRWPRRLGLVAHFRGVQGVGELGEMHVERDGFVGIADVGDGLANTALVVPASRGREVAGDAAGFLDRWLAARPQLAARYAGAERVGAVRATGPFASHARRGWAPGAALVGDAADFFDPFTGEGIYAALRGAEILAHSLEAEGGVARAVRDARRLDLALRRYERARVRAFRGKWIVERLIGLAVAHPMLVNRASRVLEGRRDMADLLVGVVGDFVPPSQVLRARYLVDLFLRQPRAARP